MKYSILFACYVALLLSGCRQKPERSVSNAFYYWRSTFELADADITRMQELHIRALYVKFFDVDWDPETKAAIPLAVTQFNTAFPSAVDLIPTVFITNSTFKNLHADDIEPLAKKMVAKIHRMLQAFSGPDIAEIQLDCDWTTTTREKYFTFLQAVQSRLWDKSIVVSATIRLHQIKYSRQTGMPPVGKGLLMCYNMGSPARIDTENSILDIEQIKHYIQTLESYPLQLDMALPLFSWGVLFYHQDFVKLINNVREHKLLDHPDFEREHDNLFRTARNTYLQNQFIFKDSLIRVEEVSAAECRRSAELLAARLPGKRLNVVLFHYDPTIVQAYTNSELQKIYSAFQKR